MDAATDAARRTSTPAFHVAATTHVVAGTGLADEVGRYASTYGARVLLVAGETHARASGLLARVESSLRAEGLDVELLEGVGANPGVAVVDAGALLARVWRADVIVALGGGSVIDVAKAIATSAAMPSSSGSFRLHLSGLRSAGLLVDSALPVVALPTMLGSGSETNGTSVIIDDETGRKLSAHSDLAAPRIAILDTELVRDAPPELLGAGCIDGVCHAIEAGLSVRSSVASDALAEQALRMLVRAGAAVLDPGAPGRDAVLLDAWWATNLAGQALTLAGSLVTHPLAHPLSARLDAHHGASVAALEPAVLATFADQFASTGALQRVARWLDVRSADDADAALRGILNRFGRACAAFGVTSSAQDLGLEEPLEAVVIRDARASGSRGLANLPGGEPTPQQLFQVLDLARSMPPTAPAKRLLAAQAAAHDRSAEDATTPSVARPTGSQLPR